MKIWCSIMDREVENYVYCPNCSQFLLCLQANGVKVN